MPTNPTLAELAAAQQDKNIFAFSLGEDARQVTRLRAVHAKKRIELEALDSLFEETSPDIVLRGATGNEVVLRLPLEATNEVYALLRQALETGLRKLEGEIVNFLLLAQQDAELVEREPDLQTDLRPAILDLCQPVALGSIGLSASQEMPTRTNPTLTAAA